MGSVFVVISGCCGDTSGKKQRVISKKTSLVPSKSWQVATSPQTQIYAWGIDPKVRFPLFLAAASKENEVSSQEATFSRQQQATKSN